MDNVQNLHDEMAWACECGSVKFNLLRSAGIECAGCGEKFGVWDFNPKIIEVEKERADYAWKNTRTIDAHRMGFEKQKNAEIEQLRGLLIQCRSSVRDNANRYDKMALDKINNGCKPDDPMLLLMVEDCENLRKIVDEIDALIETPNAKVSGPEAALSPEGRARLPGSAAGDSEKG